MASNSQVHFRGLQSLEDYEQDLGNLLGVTHHVQTQGQGLSGRQQDIRRWTRFQMLEPRLKGRDEQLTKDIKQSGEKIDTSHSDTRVAGTLKRNLKLSFSNIATLSDAEKVVNKLQINFLDLMELPRELQDPETRKEVAKWLDNEYVSSPTDRFTTDNEDCNTIFVQYAIEKHQSGVGWKAPGVELVLVQLFKESGEFFSENEQLKMSKEEADERQDTLKQSWEVRESELQDKAADADRVANEWRSRGEKLTEVEAELDTVRSELERFQEEKKRVGELTTELDREKQLRQEAEAKSTELQEDLAQLQSKLGSHDEVQQKVAKAQNQVTDLENEGVDKDNIILELKDDLQEQSTTIGRQSEAIKELADLAKHLIKVSVNPKEHLQISRFRPLLIREKIHQEFITAASGTDVLDLDVGAAALQQHVLASRYLDDGYDSNLLETMSVMQLISSALHLQASSTVLSPLQTAIQLETSLIQNLAEQPGQGSAGLVYQYGLNKAVNSTTLPFAIVCGALLTLEFRYPHSKWADIVMGLLQQKFGSVDKIQTASDLSIPAIEQLAILKLQQSLPQG